MRDRTEYATDVELVEAVAATLHVPRGLVDVAGVTEWSESLGERGWTLEERREGHYLLRHTTSGFRADVLVLPFHPDQPHRPLFEAGAGDESLRYAFSTVRLSDPDGSGLLADANLADASPDGKVTWRLDHAAASPDNTTGGGTATASPFRRSGMARLGDRLRLRGNGPVLAGLLISVLLVSIAIVSWTLLRRSRNMD